MAGAVTPTPGSVLGQSDGMGDDLGLPRHVLSLPPDIADCPSGHHDRNGPPQDHKRLDMAVAKECTRNDKHDHTPGDYLKDRTHHWMLFARHG